MKTSDSEKSSSWKIHFVSNDDNLSERLRYYLRRRGSHPLTFSSDPQSEADINIVPVEMVISIIGGDRCCTIAYGDALYLREAFLAGCEDYLKNPWNPEELSVRLGRILNRWERNCDFHWGNLVIRDKHLLSGKNRVPLTHQEYRILKMLLKFRGEIVTREALFYAIWHKQPEHKSRVIDVHVSKLNRKLSSIHSDKNSQKTISSVRAVGYSILS